MYPGTVADFACFLFNLGQILQSGDSYHQPGSTSGDGCPGDHSSLRVASEASNAEDRFHCTFTV